MDLPNLRWWGWGTLDQSYDLSNRPGFWPFLETNLGVGPGPLAEPVSLDFDHAPAAAPRCRSAAEPAQKIGRDRRQHRPGSTHPARLWQKLQGPGAPASWQSHASARCRRLSRK